MHTYLSSIHSLRSCYPFLITGIREKKILISSNRAQPLFHFPHSRTVPEKSLHFRFLACFLSHSSPLSPPPPPLPKESPHRHTRYPAVYHSIPRSYSYPLVHPWVLTARHLLTLSWSPLSTLRYASIDTLHILVHSVLYLSRDRGPTDYSLYPIHHRLSLHHLSGSGASKISPSGPLHDISGLDNKIWIWYAYTAEPLALPFQLENSCVADFPL